MIVKYIPGAPYDGMEMQRHAGPGGNWGEFIAWDPVQGKRSGASRKISMDGAARVVTGSDLVFYGTHGWLVPRCGRAQRQGAVVAEAGLGHQPPAHAFLGPDKRQYVAVYAGVGGGAGVIRHDEWLHARRQHAVCLLGGWHRHRRRHHPTSDPGGRGGAGLGAASRGTQLGQK